MLPDLIRPFRTGSEPFSLLRRDVDSLFDDFWRTNVPPNALAGTVWLPTVNVSDNSECIRVTADLPGLEKKDVTVAIDDDRLVLSGSRADEKEEKGRNWHRRERSSGEFRREVLLPCEIDANKSTATMHNGVLTVDLVKKAEALQKRRVLEIK
jgi:HSP20 family protein